MGSHQSSVDEVFLADYVGASNVTRYDIGLSEFSNFSACYYDLVVSIDILEHVPAQNIDKALAEIVGFAMRQALYTIASYPARKYLPDGRNAHVTIRSPAWWLKKTLPHIRHHGMPTTLKIIEAPHCGTLTGMILGLRRFLGLPSRKRIISASPNGSMRSI
jgi:hypothetical protein